MKKEYSGTKVNTPSFNLDNNFSNKNFIATDPFPDRKIFSFESTEPTTSASVFSQNEQDNTILSDNVELTTFQYEEEKGQAGIEDAITSSPNPEPVQSVVQFLDRYRPIAFTGADGVNNAGNTIAWNASHAKGSLIASIDPLARLMSIPIIANKLSYFSRLNCGAKIRIQVTGNQFLAGKIVAVWIPPNRMGALLAPDYKNTPSLSRSYTFVSGFPNQVSIYPTSNNTVELEIPILQSDSYWPLDSFGDYGNGPKRNVGNSPTASDTYLIPTLGTVNLYVFSEFQAPDDSVSAEIAIWAKFTNVDLPSVFQTTPWSFSDNSIYRYNEFNVSSAQTLSQPPSFLFNELSKWANNTVPQADSTPEFAPESTLATITKTANRMADAVAPPHPREASQKEHGGPLSRVSNAVGNLAGTLSSIPVVAPYATAAAAVSGLASKVFSFFNLDMPREVVNPDQRTLRFKGLAHGDGLDQTQHLSLLSANRVSAPGPNQSLQVNPSISSICAIPQVILNTSILPNQTSGSKIWSWAVSPANIPSSTAVQSYSWHGTQIQQNTNDISIQTQPTFLSKMANMFSYWRGNVTLDFEFITTSFTRSQVVIAFNPNVYRDSDITASPNEYASVTDIYSQYVLIHGNTKVRFEIPYQAATWVLSNNWCKSRKPDSDAESQIPRTPLLFNGIVSVYLVNPITTFNGSDPASITMLVSVSGTDMSFYRPSGQQLFSTRVPLYPNAIIATNAPPEEPFEPESLEATDGSTNITSIKSVSKPKTLNPDNMFGEVIDSLEYFMRRDGPIRKVSFFGSAYENTATISLFGTDVRTVGQPECAPLFLDDAQFGYPLREPSFPASFLMYLSDIFLEWKGEVAYTLLPTAPTSVTPSFLASVSDPDFKENIMTLQSGAASGTPNPPDEAQPFTDGISQVNANEIGFYAPGAAYRPNSSLVPLSVSVPYYSATSFHLTPDYWKNAPGASVSDYRVYETLPKSRNFPAVTFTTRDLPTDAKCTYTVLAHACDGFSFSRLFPPCQTTVGLSKAYMNFQYYLQDTY